MKNYKVYTREIHIERLRKMLNRKKPCSCCPKGYRYTMFNSGPWDNSDEACKICKEFVGIPSGHKTTCPCYELGMDEAIEVTLAALEKED